MWLFLTWLAITISNYVWTTFLFLRRNKEYNHEWLWIFFAIYAVTDSIAFFSASTSIGGLAVIPVYVFPKWWVTLATAFWLSWFAAPVLAMLRLITGKTKRTWLVYLFVPIIFISISELIGFSTYCRRSMMHHIYEPITLAISISLAIWYLWTSATKGEDVDFLSFASLWTSILLAMKILVLMDSNFKLNREASRIYYLVYISIMWIMYYVWHKVNRWLICKCQ